MRVTQVFAEASTTFSSILSSNLHLRFMLEPVAGLFAGRIIANDIGGPELAEMNADRRDLPVRLVGM